MTTPAHIVDGAGTGAHGKVTQDNALRASETHQRSSTIGSELLTANKLLREFMRTSAGSRDMNVNGSVTPVEFLLPAAASATITKYITSVRFLLNDATMTPSNAGDLRRFGAATAANTPLTNGILFDVFQGGTTTAEFSDPVRVLGDFFNYLDDFQSFVSGAGAGIDFLTMDFLFEKPIVLPRGSTDRAVITIRDNLSTVDKFQVLVFGWQDTT